MTRESWQAERFHLLSPGRCWQPAVDVYRERDDWLLKFDLAGVAPDEVELTLRDGCLTVAGVRRDFTVCEGRQAYSMEISYSRFERAVELPVDVESHEVKSENYHGMFLVWIRTRARRP